MESIISERRTIEWQNTRRTGIIARKSETDVIKQLAEYAKTQIPIISRLAQQHTLMGSHLRVI
jgi:hypothetical protein